MSQPEQTPAESSHELPSGFRYAGATGGIKASGKPDVSLIVSDQPCVAAAVTTTNQVFAAPVQVCRDRSPRSTCRAVITNSGNANACTGQEGYDDAVTMCERVAAMVGCDAEDVLVMSTGVIGHRLPMAKVEKGILLAGEALGDSERHFLAAADAICTTDQFRKTASASFQSGGKTYRIAAMCKGAGMIAPNMATMLGVIVTDFPLTEQTAQTSLRRIVERTFNRVSVDGHTSTNDTVVLLSSGQTSDVGSDADNATFIETATDVSLNLAKLLVADGEGAVRFFEVAVDGAASDDDAFEIAKCVAASPLVKTAIQGGDPNWGRIVSAAGYAGPKIEVEKTALSIEGSSVFRDGRPLPFDAAELSSLMKAASEVKLQLVVGSGSGSAKYWSSDLTEDYVRFNSLYTT
ncbi:bifunctional glutamate N-acetyltransferase/amino-acid acetyltransferase ArgJ [Rhodopirellula sp. SWK7]|uniref:bifunctional glutamate N-acetyltransferase/amino-acid acetyltransferase ArgJ n=1 Tax=Rhodopirellula sp. SWK7 TaxID=595460 RepID=UPI0002BDE4E6|nr:bifunctional glutamate N-acetyltransferase/amino-acid acetyltransferase ArgJ [Rhodopirellula sp. SWK7]EMI44378.1 bifunctional ornithine acetyltransferase/N-acetylglutamate synthase protein [Rhodopirellula sp. SWK7]